MATNLQDRKTISINQVHEVAYWSKKFGVSKISVAPIPDAGRTDPPRFRSFPLDENRALLTNRDSDPIQMSYQMTMPIGSHRR